MLQGSKKCCYMDCEKTPGKLARMSDGVEYIKRSRLRYGRTSGNQKDPGKVQEAKHIGGGAR